MFCNFASGKESLRDCELLGVDADKCDKVWYPVPLASSPTEV